MKASPKILVVGAGIAGLAAVMRAVELGLTVELLTLHPLGTASSVTCSGGIAVVGKGEDSLKRHFEDTISGADFLARQGAVQSLCEDAARILRLCERLGVVFGRTPEGHIALTRTDGFSTARTAFSGASTGMQVLQALAGHARRLIAESRLKIHEGWDFVTAVLDQDAICRGLVAQETRTLEIRAFAADAVILATGGMGRIFADTTCGPDATGAAVGAVYRQGAALANPEFVQFHPYCVRLAEKHLALPDGLLAAGACVWADRQGGPWHFLAEEFPRHAAFLPADVASRALVRAKATLAEGSHGGSGVFLDMTGAAAMIDGIFPGIAQRVQRLTGMDLITQALPIEPAATGILGGLWVGDDGMTGLRGLFAAGECALDVHGANRLSGNDLSARIHGGWRAVDGVARYVAGLRTTWEAVDGRVFTEELRRQANEFQAILDMNGPESAHRVKNEMRDLMSERCGLIRHDGALTQATSDLTELLERYDRIGLSDRGTWLNQEAFFVRGLRHMLELAKAIVLAAGFRQESRGTHYKPAAPERDDENFLRTTKVQWGRKGPVVSYEEVDTPFLKPAMRRYDI